MNDLLTRVLHDRADTTAPAGPDLDTILAEGRRRVRRRRVGAGLVAAVLAGTVAGTALSLPTPGAPRDGRQHLAAAPDGGFTERRSSYADGDVIHWGDRSFTVEGAVSSYVQTDDGFVYTTDNGNVWLHDGTAVEKVGHAEGNRLRADDSGSLVTWVDRTEDGAPQYVFFDTSDGREVTRFVDDSAVASAAEDERDAEVLALDDGVAYLRQGPDMVAYEIATGEESVLDTWSPPADPAEKSEPVALEIVDAAGGVLAYHVDAGAQWGLRVGPGIDTAPGTDTLARASHGVLSPSARFLGAEEEDDIAVYDVSTGADVTPDLAGYPYAVPYGWVDDDTAMVFALDRLQPQDGRYTGDLLECDIPDGTCRAAAELSVRPSTFTLPVGDPMGT